MSVAGGPYIIENGLVMCLDAASQLSYPGTGTAWYDVSNTGNNGTLINSPAYSSVNGGNINFNGTNNYVTVTNNTTLRPTTELTIEYAMIGNSPGAWNPILGYGNGDYTNGNYLTWIEVGGALNSLCSINNGGVTEYRQYSNQGVSSTIWKMMSFTMKIGDAIRSYYNGNDTNSPTSLPSGGSFYYGGTTSAYQVGGYGGAWISANIAYVRLYNRALSPLEILQNYNAHKSRFGLS